MRQFIKKRLVTVEFQVRTLLCFHYNQLIYLYDLLIIDTWNCLLQFDPKPLTWSTLLIYGTRFLLHLLDVGMEMSTKVCFLNLELTNKAFLMSYSLFSRTF